MQDAEWYDQHIDQCRVNAALRTKIRREDMTERPLFRFIGIGLVGEAMTTPAAAAPDSDIASPRIPNTAAIADWPLPVQAQLLSRNGERNFQTERI